MSALPRKRYTPGEYLELERQSEIKHEYINGEIYAMSGVSRSHDQIVWNLAATLDPQIRKSGCKGHTGDMRVKLNSRSYVYPDLSIVCGDPLFVVEAGLDNLVNPTLVIEVLSSSTEQYDRGEKFLHYQSLDSLREYVLIAQRKPLIEVFTRQPNGKWQYEATQGLEASVMLESIGCTLSMADVYRDVIFEPEVSDSA